MRDWIKLHYNNHLNSFPHALLYKGEVIIWETSHLNSFTKYLVRRLFKAHLFSCFFLKPILCCIYRPLVTFIECLPSDRPSAKGWIPMSDTDKSRSLCFQTHYISNYKHDKLLWGKKKLSFFFYSPHKARGIFSKHKSADVTDSLLKPSNDSPYT